jgi:hypothetical protein
LTWVVSGRPLRVAWTKDKNSCLVVS